MKRNDVHPNAHLLLIHTTQFPPLSQQVTDQPLAVFELEEMAAAEVLEGGVGALLGAATVSEKAALVRTSQRGMEPLLTNTLIDRHTVNNWNSKRKVEVRNCYFEPVPFSTQEQRPLVTCLVTEEGPAEGGAATAVVQAKARERRRQYERLFLG